MSNSEQQDSKDFCSTAEAAEMLGVAPKTIQVWVEAGALQAWKTVGGHRRIVMSSINDMLAGRAGVLPKSTERPIRKRTQKILIVDDDPALLLAYESEMSTWSLPLQVLKALDGFDAMIQIGQQDPDILVTDLSMTGMDGFRMISRLHNNPASRLRIIVVTGLDPATVSLLGLPSDIHVLPKPVQLTDLRAVIEGMLSL